MKKLLLAIATILVTLFAYDTANAQYLTVLASGCVADGSGTLISSGTMTVVGTDANDNPIPYRAGTSTMSTTAPITRTITAGSLATSLQLADPLLSQPVGILYRFVVTDNITKKITVYRQIVLQANDTVVGGFFTQFNFCKMNPLPFTSQVVYAAGPITDSSIRNFLLGFQIAGVAPSGHIVVGNGTAYLDSAFPAAAASALGGVNSKDCSATGHLQKINTDGSITCSADAAFAGGIQFQKFTSSGTFTIPAGVTIIEVTVTAGGGGGGASSTSGQTSAGGGSGSTGIKWLSGLTPGNTLTVTVGTGGSGNSGTSGSAGTASSVSSGTQTITSITTSGGGGGGTLAIVGGPGAAGSGGDINLQGGGGWSGCSTNVCAGGAGGTSYWGAGGQPTGTAGSNGFGTVNPGAGGGGGNSNGSAVTGGSGSAGIVLFKWIK